MKLLISGISSIDLLLLKMLNNILCCLSIAVFSFFPFPFFFSFLLISFTGPFLVLLNFSHFLPIYFLLALNLNTYDSISFSLLPPFVQCRGFCWERQWRGKKKKSKQKYSLFSTFFFLLFWCLINLNKKNSKKRT